MKSRTIVAVWACILLLSPSLPALDWPDHVEVGQLLILDAPEGVACTWEVSGQDIDGDPYDPVYREFPSALVVETRYRGLVTVGLATDARRGLVDVRWSIAIGDDDDEPDPPPPPPVSGKIFAVFVTETDDHDEYTPDQVNAFKDTADKEYMTRKGYFYRKVDQDVVEPDGRGGDRPPLDIASFLQRAKSHQASKSITMNEREIVVKKNLHLPRLIIADQSGAVLHDDVVVDEASVLSTLKQYGGE